MFMIYVSHYDLHIFSPGRQQKSRDQKNKHALVIKND